jgi:hypothetical protein
MNWNHLATAKLYERAAYYLRRYDDSRSPVEATGWRELLASVTNEIVLREIELAA